LHLKNKQKKQKIAKYDFQYGGWNYCTLQCGMWLWNHDSEFTKCTAKTDFLEQISKANLRLFIHPNFAFLSGPNKVDLRGISKLIEVK